RLALSPRTSDRLACGGVFRNARGLNTVRSRCPSSLQNGGMEENGALLNRDQLASAHLLARSLATRPGLETQSQSQIRRRAGAVQEAVIRALAQAERPLRAREIHQAAQELAETPLSW